MTIERFILVILLLVGCGEGNNSGLVKYYLERDATATTSNQLIFEIQGPFRPKFSLSGTGFTAAVPFDTVLDTQDSTALSAADFGEVSIKLTLYQENDKAYLTDTLTWKSSTEVPPAPDPYFSEDASADAWVFLVLPSTRGRNVKEVWVEGDLDSSVAAGQYYEIPSDDQVLLHLSEGDGLKTMRVRYRNIFGTEGETVTASIQLKSQPPANCKATPVASTTATGSVRTRIQADNDGPLYFRVDGAVANPTQDFQAFENWTDTMIALSPTEGTKAVRVKIHDAAGNFCDDIPLTLKYDKSYVPGSVAFQGQELWTDDLNAVIIPAFDQLPGDNVSMYISGTIAASADTFQWVPYSASVSVTLTPTNGTRHVIVQYKKDSTVMAEVTASIFLKPYVLVSGSGAVVDVIPADIVGTRFLTLVGCAESYVQVAYASRYSCTKTAANATITYYLSDGTSVTRSAAF